MLDIAVVDDDEILLADVRRGIEVWAEAQDMPVHVTLYRNADQFEFSFGASRNPDVVFMDIGLGSDKDGVDLARQLRSADAETTIVFLTADSSPQRLLEGYKVQALDYLVKPVDSPVLFACLDRIARNVQERAERALVFAANGGVRRVLFSRIVYLEAERKAVTVHTKDRDYKIWTSLTVLETELPPQITRCTRGILVNLRYVESIQPDRLTLRDGTQLPVSRRCFGPLRERFVLYSTGCEL